MMMFDLSATKVGIDLAAYCFPANATIYPPAFACKISQMSLKINSREEMVTYRIKVGVNGEESEFVNFWAEDGECSVSTEGEAAVAG